MKRTRWMWICSALLASGLMATASWAQVPTPGGPEDQGIPISGVSQELAPVWGGPFAGAATLTIDGISYPVAVTSNSLVLADLPDNFGRLVGTTEHVLDFGDGNLIRTSDEVLLTPTQPGWFLVQATMKITSGTGMFSSASGEIAVYGNMAADGSTATSLWLIDGRFSV